MASHAIIPCLDMNSAYLSHGKVRDADDLGNLSGMNYHEREDWDVGHTFKTMWGRQARAGQQTRTQQTEPTTPIQLKPSDALVKPVM